MDNIWQHNENQSSEDRDRVNFQNIMYVWGLLQWSLWLPMWTWRTDQGELHFYTLALSRFCTFTQLQHTYWSWSCLNMRRSDGRYLTVYKTVSNESCRLYINQRAPLRTFTITIIPELLHICMSAWKKQSSYLGEDETVMEVCANASSDIL
jgi:hypothetical protein